MDLDFTLIIYDDIGRIQSVIQSSDPHQIAVNVTNNHVLLYEAVDISEDTHYVKDKELTERPAQLTEFDSSKLSNLPVPCTIYINGTAYECTDSTAELELDQPGRYSIRVEAWPYLDFETTYENQA